MPIWSGRRTHMRIASIEIGPTEQMPGVIAVLTGGGAEGDGLHPIPHRPVPTNPHEVPLKSRDGSPFFVAPHAVLAVSKVRHVSEAIALAGRCYPALRSVTGRPRHWISVRAEFERELIRLCTAEGRERAKANGKSFGRPFKLAPHRRRDDSGDETLAEIGRSYNVNIFGLSGLSSPQGIRPFSTRRVSGSAGSTTRTHRRRLRRCRLEKSRCD